MHRDEDHVVVGHQLDGNFDVVHHRDRRAVGGMNGISLLTGHHAAPQVHQPWHPEAPDCARVICRGSASRMASSPLTVSIVSSFSAICMATVLSTGCRPLMAYAPMIGGAPDRCIDVDQADRGMRAAGFEPARPVGQGVLSALCLPVPSRPRAANSIITTAGAINALALAEICHWTKTRAFVSPIGGVVVGNLRLRGRQSWNWRRI